MLRLFEDAAKKEEEAKANKELGKIIKKKEIAKLLRAWDFGEKCFHPH
jgi:hypothetical protein